MTDSPKEFRAISGCWRVSVTRDEDGVLVGEDFLGPIERSVGYQFPEMVFRNDDPKSKTVVQGAAKTLSRKPTPHDGNVDDEEVGNEPPMDQ